MRQSKLFDIEVDEMKEVLKGNGLTAVAKSKLEGLPLRCIAVRDVNTERGAAKVYDVEVISTGEAVSFFGTPVIDKQEIAPADTFVLRKVKTKDKLRSYWAAFAAVAPEQKKLGDASDS